MLTRKYNYVLSFYGFPPEYYEAEYPHKGSPDLAFKVMSLLSSAGIKSTGVTRGLDHGVWSGFHVGAFFRSHKNLYLSTMCRQFHD